LQLLDIFPQSFDAGSRGLSGVLTSSLMLATSKDVDIVCRYEYSVLAYLHECKLFGRPYDSPFGADVPGAVLATALDVEQMWCFK
jgi:hypothetical protein